MNNRKHVAIAATTSISGSYSARDAFSASLTACTLYCSIPNTNFVCSRVEGILRSSLRTERSDRFTKNCFNKD